MEPRVGKKGVFIRGKGGRKRRSGNADKFSGFEGSLRAGEHRPSL